MKGKNIENVSCNFCGNDKADVFYKHVTSWEHAGVFTVVKCRMCQLVYVNPRPVQAVIGKYYPPESYWGDDVTESQDKHDLNNLRKESYGYLYRIILEHKKKGRVLDIGAGTGMFLSYFKDLGFQVEGVEYSNDACVYAKKMFGVKLKNGDFLTKKFKKNTFSMVTLNNSLEHLYDPLNTLVGAYKTMKKGGVIVVTVPNIESLGSILFKEDWYALQPPRHLFHFSEKTLSLMMTQAGFKKIEIKRGYILHNYHTLFESIRLTRSEKFKKTPKGGVVAGVVTPSNSLKKEVFKVGAKALAFALAILGSVIHKSEVITVIAYK